jgi:hypothetical protein
MIISNSSFPSLQIESKKKRKLLCYDYSIVSKVYSLCLRECESVCVCISRCLSVCVSVCEGVSASRVFWN